MIASEIIHLFESAVGPMRVITHPAERKAFASDALLHYHEPPELVVFPETTEQISSIVKICNTHHIPFTPRGSGTGLSGGATPSPESVVIATAKMRKIHRIDIANRLAVVDPGVINSDITKAVASAGYFYAPDPSSQSVSTIGGNVAENAGGIHCFKYGFTVNHILGAQKVLGNGDIVEVGGEAMDMPGYNLLSVIVGSEGTLGIVTCVTVRLTAQPQSIVTALVPFASMESAGAAVSAIIAAGIVPAAIERMDQLTLQVCENTIHAGYPENAAAILLVELDGPQAEVEARIADVAKICRNYEALNWKIATLPAERALLWKGRKAAFAALGQLGAHLFLHDGVVPRTKLPEALKRLTDVGRRSGLWIATVLHAGDGNLHPVVLYNDDQEALAEQVAADILTMCVELGGSITGEHGVGLDKREFMNVMFTENDMAAHQKLRLAFDPLGISNPGKIYPAPNMCGEGAKKYKQHPLEQNGTITRL